MLKLALFFLGCICFAAASDVLVLTEADFASTLKENPNIFVEFYAPWCGHCKALAPEYEQLATSLKGKVPIAKVDCTTEQNVCTQEGIQGYPTIKFFKNGQAVAYNGERKAEPMESWILKKSGDAFTLISSQDAENELIAAGPAVIAHFSNKDSDLFKQFNEIAQLTEDIGFGAVFDSSAVSDFKADSIKAVVEGKTTNFDGSDLSAWVSEHGFPLVDKLNQKGFERFVKLGKKYFVLLFAPQVEPKETVKVLEGVAADYRKDLGFLWDLGEQYAQHGSKLGFSGEKFPVIVAMNEKEKFFPMGESQEFNAENIKAFFDNLLAGKVEAHSQSEAIPESNDGPVKIVVGKNFEEVVTKSSSDVFLEVYAPWCGHCKSLAPVWDKLGERLAGKSVTIAKVDATANDIPVSVQGFPTLLYFKAGNAEPTVYEGGRDLESLLNFIKEQSTHLKDEL